MHLPGLPIVGLPKPLSVKIDFDAGVIDQIIERLLVLRAQMLPPQLLTARGLAVHAERAFACWP